MVEENKILNYLLSDYRIQSMLSESLYNYLKNNERERNRLVSELIEETIRQASRGQLQLVITLTPEQLNQIISIVKHDKEIKDLLESKKR